jgi:large subunit ribosomal protein L13
MSTDTFKVYDAEQMVVGRLGTKVAKAALLGENIVIINVEKAIITGDPHTLISAWKEKFKIRTSYKHERGPFHDRRPDKMVRRMIRGMLPWPTPRGKAAFKRIKVFIGTPERYADAEKIVLEKSRYRSMTQKHIVEQELSRELGWRYPEVV